MQPFGTPKPPGKTGETGGGTEGGDGAEEGFQPGTHYEATYLTHRFFARLPDGRLVEERRVDRVYIEDCFARRRRRRNNPAAGSADCGAAGETSAVRGRCASAEIALGNKDPFVAVYQRAGAKNSTYFSEEQDFQQLTFRLIRREKVGRFCSMD